MIANCENWPNGRFLAGSVKRTQVSHSLPTSHAPPAEPTFALRTTTPAAIVVRYSRGHFNTNSGHENALHFQTQYISPELLFGSTENGFRQIRLVLK